MKLAKISLTSPIVAISVALCAALSSFGAPRYRLPITTSGYTGSETLYNFPLLVKLGEGQPEGFSYSQFQPGQTDLAFEDENGNALNYEIDTWYEEGISFVWVSVPTLTKTTRIVATWGDPDATTEPAARTKGAVWSAAGYAGVWHMDETANQGTEDYVALDASGNDMTAVPMKSGTTDFTPMVSWAEGAVGRARVNQDAANRKIGLKVDGYKGIAEEIAANGTITVSGWFNASEFNRNSRVFGQKIYYSDPDGWEVQEDGSARTYKNDVSIAGTVSKDTNAPLNKWHHYAFVVRGTDTVSSFLLNGSVMASKVLPAIAANTVSFTIGNDGDCNEVNYVGRYDEVRLLKTAVPNDWVKAEYDTVANAAFYDASVLIDVTTLNYLLIEAANESVPVKPAFGKITGLADGETVPFSAPEGEIRMPSGDYVTYTGYRLYVIRDNQESLLVDSDDLSGTYTHAANTSARLEWKQSFREVGRLFPTAYSSQVSVPGFVAAETLEDFPVLFRLSANAPEGFSYADCRADGNDILFTDSDGRVIPHEIEKWYPEGESLIWVKLPRLAVGTRFRFCYGNPDIEMPAPGTNVWADCFAGVWHLDESGVAAAAIDATGRGNDGVASATAKGDLTEMTATDGAISGGRTIATAAAANYYRVPNADVLDLGETFTVSAWIRGTGTSNARIFNRKSYWSNPDGWEVQWDSSNKVGPRGSKGDTNGSRDAGITAKTWTYVACVYDGAAVSVYGNGVKAGEDVLVTPVVDNDEPFDFGNASVANTYLFNGAFDEVRLMGGAASAARVKADYDTVASATFLSADPVKAAAGANVLTVESAGREIGEVTPDWGEHKDLADGQVIPFSAPAGEQVESDDVHYAFTGYSLYTVDADGAETLVESRDATSGTYTHVAGQSARLVWREQDLYHVSVAAEHGTVTGAGYVPKGSTVTLRAVADEGYRFREWIGEGVPEDQRKELEITLTVAGAMPLTARFSAKPKAVAFWDFKGGAVGSPVAEVANSAGSETFVGTGAALDIAAGAVPSYSDETPGFTVYSDDTCSEVLAENPQSVYFAGGDVSIARLGSWMSQQDACTVEFFCRGDIEAQFRSVYSLDIGNDPHMVYYPGVDPGDIRFTCETTASGNSGYVSPAGSFSRSAAYDAWHHVAVVYSRTRQTATLYFDHQFQSAAKTVSLVEQSGSVPLHLGTALANGGSKSSYFVGRIACLRVCAGELVQEDFMRVAPTEPVGDTLALYSFRGRTGAPVTSVKPKIGNSRMIGGVRTAADGVLPIHSDDIPGEALYDGEAGLKSGVPLVRWISSVAFTNDESKTSTSSYIDCFDMGTVLSARDSFTIEWFAKYEGGKNWKTPISFNVTGATLIGSPTRVAMPEQSVTSIRTQNPSAGPVTVPSLHENQVWHHLALTYNSIDQLLRLYVDYSNSPVSGHMDKVPTVSSLIIGSGYTIRQQDGGSRVTEAFRGKIAGVRVSTRALQPSEFLRAAPRPDSGLMLLVR